MYRRSLFTIKRMKDLLKFSSSCAITSVPLSTRLLGSQILRFGFKNKSTFLKTAVGLTLFTWNDEKKESNPEDDLILNIKWSILLIQRKEFAKAEQLLHIALRMAQQLHNEDGITYIHDVMANLALDLGQFDKAEKLFIDVMQRLISSGVPKDDIKNIHISLKLARICHMKGDKDKAAVGYRWTIENLEKKIGNDLTSQNNLLLALANEWYARIMVDEENFKQALHWMTASYDILTRFEDSNEEQIVILLNDMATMSEKLNDLNTSEKYLKEAIKRGHLIKDMEELGPIYVNLGRIYLRKNMFEKARKCCGYGWKLGIDRENKECMEQASLCLEEAKNMKIK